MAQYAAGAGDRIVAGGVGFGGSGQLFDGDRAADVVEVVMEAAKIATPQGTADGAGDYPFPPRRPMLSFASMSKPDPTPAAPPSASVRLDLWLWAARFFKTRSLARQAIDTGKVEVGGQRAKASRALRVGDGLRIARGEEIFEVAVLGLSDSRGPANVAQALYAETEASRAAREQLRALRVAERNGYRAPETKPDKRARRLIKALGDIDAL